MAFSDSVRCSGESVGSLSPFWSVRPFRLSNDNQLQHQCPEEREPLEAGLQQQQPKDIMLAALFALMSVELKQNCPKMKSVQMFALSVGS